MRSAPLRSRRAAPRPMAPRTTASCTHAASSTSTATAGRSCGWTPRRRNRAPRRSPPPCRTPTPRPDPPPRGRTAPATSRTCRVRGEGRRARDARRPTPRGRDSPGASRDRRGGGGGGPPRGGAPPLLPPLPDDDPLEIELVGVIRRGDHDLAVGRAEVVGPAVDRERADLVAFLE